MHQRYLGNAGDLAYGNSISALEHLQSLAQSLRNMQTIKFGHDGGLIISFYMRIYCKQGECAAMKLLIRALLVRWGAVTSLK